MPGYGLGRYGYGAYGIGEVVGPVDGQPAYPNDVLIEPMVNAVLVELLPPNDVLVEALAPNDVLVEAAVNDVTVIPAVNEVIQ